MSKSTLTALPEPTPVPAVAVIDDDVAHADSVIALLETQSLSARAWYSGQEGLDYVLEHSPAVLILDLDMPGVSGIDVLSAVTDAGISTKTIVLTGTHDVALVGNIVRLGAYDFLTKPADPARLLATVERAREMLALEQESRSNAAAARRSNSLHEFLVQATPDLVYMLDDKGKFTYLNNKLKQVFEINSETLIGASWEHLFGTEQISLELARHVRERRTVARGAREFEFEYTPAAGSVRTLLCASTGLYQSPGHREFTGTYGVIRDITERRRAERDRLELQSQIQQASKMEAMGQLAGGIAHDFNNILASIIGYAELVQSAHARLQGNAIEDYLGEVIIAGHRARDLIAQMLTFTRTNRSEPVAVDVPEVIDNVSRMLRAAIPSSIHIQSEFEPGLPAALADKIQLQQILLNLMVNARDAIAGTGVIKISLARATEQSVCDVCGKQIAEQTLRLAVADTGHGIPDQVRPRIFDMYYTTRSDGGSAAADSGTGLGLWLINSLVHDHGGHIKLVSAEDEGTTFSVYLPFATQAQPPALAKPSIRLPGELVVVDDEVSVGNFIGEVLTDNGFDVRVFSDSQSALAYVQEHHAEIAMLITDQAMPVITGLELTESVRAIDPTITIILITAFTAETDRKRMQQLGVEGYLAKPFRIADLLGAINRHAPAVQ
ncbi:MAG: response regulator [Pseudomonadales bacterium]